MYEMLAQSCGLPRASIESRLGGNRARLLDNAAPSRLTQNSLEGGFVKVSAWGVVENKNSTITGGCAPASLDEQPVIHGHDFDDYFWIPRGIGFQYS